MKTLLYTLSGILFLGALAYPRQSSAQTPLGSQLTRSTIIEDQDFGFSVDVFGDVAIVGAFRDEDGLLLETGAAYVYRYDGTQWTEEQKLEASDRGILNWFGWEVALEEDIALVTARNGDTFANNGGDVTVFRYSAGMWQEETILTPSDQVISDFGFATDIDGDLIAVGAPFHSGLVTGTTEGAVYVYRFDGANWNEEDILFGSDLSNQSQFGNAISIDGDRMLVGAFNADDSTSNQAGKLYVFDYDGTGWNETAVLQSNRSNNIANLGVSVGLDGEWAIGGAQLDSELTGGSGAVFVYRYDGQSWNFHSKLNASDGNGFYLFGISAALEGETLLVGAENWLGSGGATGKAYLFEYDAMSDTWVETAGFVPDEADVGGKFGKSAAMQGGTMILGAPEYSGTEDDMGTAFIFGEPAVATSLEENHLPSRFAFSAPYPNPFTTRTTFTVTPEATGPVHISLFDMLGREVKSLFASSLAGGSPASFDITSSDLPDGIYWIRVETSHSTLARSIILRR